MKRVLAVFFAMMCLVSSMSLSAYAAVAPEYEVAPCYNNTTSAGVSLIITDSGTANVILKLRGTLGVTEKIVAETKLQRKVGLIWVTVSGAEWTDTLHAYYMDKTHSVQLTKTGTYRAKTTYTVSGSGGADDDIVVTSPTDTY